MTASLHPTLAPILNGLDAAFDRAEQDASNAWNPIAAMGRRDALRVLRAMFLAWAGGFEGGEIAQEQARPFLLALRGLSRGVLAYHKRTHTPDGAGEREAVWEVERAFARAFGLEAVLADREIEVEARRLVMADAGCDWEAFCPVAW